jgi:hypothetical protein
MQYRHMILSLVSPFALVPASGAQEDAILMPPVPLVCAQQYPALSTTPLGTMMSGIPEVSRQMDAAKTCLANRRPCRPDSVPNSCTARGNRSPSVPRRFANSSTNTMNCLASTALRVPVTACPASRISITED